MTQQENFRYSSPRLSIDINEHQFASLQRLIPHGLKRQIFTVIIDDLISILEHSTKREAVFAAIINRMVNIPMRSLEINDEP